MAKTPAKARARDGRTQRPEQLRTRFKALQTAGEQLDMTVRRIIGILKGSVHSPGLDDLEMRLKLVSGNVTAIDVDVAAFLNQFNALREMNVTQG